MYDVPCIMYYNDNLKVQFCTIWKGISPAFQILPLQQRVCETENPRIQKHPIL